MIDPRARRRYLFGDVGVSITAPAEILHVLDVTMLHVRAHDASCRISLTVTRTPAAWEIVDEFGPVVTLSAQTAAPEVSGALTTAIAERVAQQSTWSLVTGVIVAKDDFAVALVGDDWGSCLGIAMHLSLRGWTIVTPRYAFVDPDTRAVEPFSKLLYVPSRIIPLLPLAYRRALEASPWYSTGNELGFYGVDHVRAKAPPHDAKRPTLRACLILDASRSELLGSIREPAHAYVGTFLPFSDVGIASASLIVGSIVPTTDAVERWVESHMAIS